MGKNIPGSGSSQCKGPEAGCATVAEAQSVSEGRVGEGVGNTGIKGVDLSGLEDLSKDLAFTQCALRSHCRVLNRGVIGSNLHLRRSTLVTMWRINCKGRSREIS